MVFAPIYMKDAVLTLDGDAFQIEVSSAKFVPANTVATWQGLTPEAIFNDVATTWTLELTVGQDYDTTTSLSRYLLENPGITVPAVLEPRAGGVGYTANVTLAPVGIGGAGRSFAEDTTSLPSTIPTLVP